MITIRDIAWTAGFIEGEGSFSYNTSLRIGVSQVQLQPLKKLQKLYGGAICKCKTKTSYIYSWSLQGIQAAGLLMTIFSLMSPRRKGQMMKVYRRWKKARVSTKYKLQRASYERGLH